MRDPMSIDEFNNAKDTLGWNYPQLARALGVSTRTPFRWASGEYKPLGPEARLLRLFVLLRLTVSERKFDELMEKLR